MDVLLNYDAGQFRCTLYCFCFAFD